MKILALLIIFAALIACDLGTTINWRKGWPGMHECETMDQTCQHGCFVLVVGQTKAEDMYIGMDGNQLNDQAFNDSLCNWILSDEPGRWVYENKNGRIACVSEWKSQD